MRKLSVKTKFMLQVMFGFFISGIICLKVFLGNDKIDRIAANNIQISILIFLGIISVSLFASYIFNYVKGKVFEKPIYIEKLLNVLNYQVLLFALMYFFIDTLFDNSYLQLPPFLTDKYLILNIFIFATFLITYKLKNKEISVRQIVITALISGFLFFQLNCIEIIFIVLYFLLMRAIEKNDHIIRKVLNLYYKFNGKKGLKLLGGTLSVMAVIFSKNIGAALITISVIAFLGLSLNQILKAYYYM